MPNEDVDRAFREGRLSRRAYVRQLVDGGTDMQAALARADELVPMAPPPTAPTAVPEPEPAALQNGARPRHVDGLDVNFVGDGYIVYHPSRRRMHSLNNTAALVFELCTGENDTAEIAGLLQRTFGLDEAPAAEVEECLASLVREGLIR